MVACLPVLDQACAAFKMTKALQVSEGAAGRGQGRTGIKRVLVVSGSFSRPSIEDQAARMNGRLSRAQYQTHVTARCRAATGMERLPIADLANAVVINISTQCGPEY